jgi:large subunit ribosomal protein L13
MTNHAQGKTTAFSHLADQDRQWYVVDAQDVVLGKLATEVANVLRGKNKASFTPNVDCGDNVIIINADKVHLSGRKMEQKLYRSHSGYLGHLKEVTAKDVMAKKPTKIVENAVYGMLPKNKLRKHFFKKLYVYAGPEHKHAGQNPTPLEVK